jgi:hypothetical protein
VKLRREKMEVEYWEVSCVDQRFDDEGFQLGRTVKGKDGRLRYETHPDVFEDQVDAENVARMLNKEIEDGKS